jgi:hypothetical protein
LSRRTNKEEIATNQVPSSPDGDTAKEREIVRVVITFTIEKGKIMEINLIGDPDGINRVDLVLFAG